MAFDVTALVAYVEENKADLIFKPITMGRIFDLPIDIREGVISGEKIPRLESTVPAQGDNCGFTSSGTTTIDQTTVTTATFMVQEALCLDDLEAGFAQKWLPAGSNAETFTKEQDWVNRKLANINKKITQAAFQGKTTYTNDTYLKRINGWIANIDTVGTAVAATQQASISTSTVRGIVEDIIFSKLPLAISETGDEAIFMGVDNYRLLLNKLLTDGAYWYTPQSGEFKGNEMMYPGTNVRIIGLNEMNANNTVDGGGSLPTAVKNRILAGSMKNFVAGFNLKADMSDFKVWYSEDNRQLRFNWRAKFGVSNHFVDQIVQYTNL